MQETTPGSYDDQPPPSTSIQSAESQQAQHQRQDQTQGAAVESQGREDSISDDGSLGSAATDTSYLDSYTSDLDNDPEDVVVHQQPWNPSGQAAGSYYSASYIPPLPSSAHGDYRNQAYNPVAPYGVPPGYAPSHTQSGVAGPSHVRQHSLQGDQTWPAPHQRPYGGQPSTSGPSYANYRNYERYSSAQASAWQAQALQGQTTEHMGRSSGSPYGRLETAAQPEWERSEQPILPYLRRGQGPPPHLESQVEDAVSHQYGQRSRILEQYPGLARSQWMREMASTPEHLEQLIAQFPSLVGDIHLAPDRPGQQNPNILPRLRVNTTLWEAETTICIVVEIDQRSVSRRCDNNMVNGTKLLNVARISRGRRDGILKGEKIRKVVKVGNMNNKGVWIPYERALEIAQREEILDSLYPLFVVDLNPLLYSSSNQSRLKQMLLKGAQKNPEFRKWFDGIPTFRAQAQARAQQSPFRPPPHQMPPQMESQSRGQRSQAPPPSGYSQAPPGYSAPAELPRPGPGPSGTSAAHRTHRRTRSRQQQALMAHQPHQPQGVHKGASVQKHSRQRREHERAYDAQGHYRERSSNLTSPGTFFGGAGGSQRSFSEQGPMPAASVQPPQAQQPLGEAREAYEERQRQNLEPRPPSQAPTPQPPPG